MHGHMEMTVTKKVGENRSFSEDMSRVVGIICYYC